MAFSAAGGKNRPAGRASMPPWFGMHSKDYDQDDQGSAATGKELPIAASD
jgi:hypothetical protein